MSINVEREGRYKLEVPTLKSLFIEMCFQDKVLATGTAFLVANTRESHCSLITNRHNVTGRHQESGQCLSRSGGVPDAIAIYFHKNSERLGEWAVVRLPLYREDGSPYWYEHSILGPAADIVAMNLTWGNDVTKYPYFLELDLDRGIEVGPAEPISVIGFPFGLSSAGHFPIWATGFLAQELSLVTPDNPTFLIDCRTRQGQSGSPVIAYRVGSYRKRTGDKISSVLSPHPVWEFLGIYSGRVNPESDLGRVWHVSAIEDLLATATEDAQRRERNRNAKISEQGPAKE